MRRNATTTATTDNTTVTLTPLTLARRIDARYNDYTEQNDTSPSETEHDTLATVTLTHESYEELHEHAQTKRALAVLIASLCSCSVTIQRAPSDATTDTVSFGNEPLPLVG